MRRKYDSDKPVIYRSGKSVEEKARSNDVPFVTACRYSESYRSQRVVDYTRDVIYFRKMSRRGTSEIGPMVSRYHRYERSRSLPIGQ